MCDFDRSDVYRERLVRARIAQDCYACGQRIVPGETYEYASGVWDGSGASFKRHLLCSVLERAQGECGCWTFGSLPEGFGDEVSWVLKKAWQTVMAPRLEER